MKTNLVVESAKIFNIKQFGNGCKFGIKVSSKKQDGTYTKGVFLNCKYPKEMLGEGLYTLSGFLGDNEYNDKNTLELIVQTAVKAGTSTKPKQDDTDSIPF